MEKTIEKTNAELVRRKVRDALKQFDFKKTKPSFYTRLLEDRIEFIHLHKFSFGPSFRVHTGIRFLIDNFEAVALNGIDSDSRREYNLRYHKSEESVDRCASEIFLFIENESFPWLEKWRNDEFLFRDSSSPFQRELMQDYQHFKSGDRDESIIKLIKQSKSLLGIKD